MLRGLHDKPDLLRLLLQRHFGQRPPAVENLSFCPAKGSQRRFELPQQGAFAAAGQPAQGQPLPFRNGQANILQGGSRSARIGKTQIFDFKNCHRSASFPSISRGKNTNSPNSSTAPARRGAAGAE